MLNFVNCCLVSAALMLILHQEGICEGWMITCYNEDLAEDDYGKSFEGTNTLVLKRACESKVLLATLSNKGFGADVASINGELNAQVLSRLSSFLVAFFKCSKTDYAVSNLALHSLADALEYATKDNYTSISSCSHIKGFIESYTLSQEIPEIFQYKIDDYTYNVLGEAATLCGGGYEKYSCKAKCLNDATPMIEKAFKNMTTGISKSFDNLHLEIEAKASLVKKECSPPYLHNDAIDHHLIDILKKCLS